MTTQKTVRGWIGYDGECPLCVGIVNRFGRIWSQRGFRWIPLQDRFWSDRLGIPAGKIPDEMKLMTPEGQILSGADAWVFLVGRIHGFQPLTPLLRLPGLRRLTLWAYDWISTNRYCLGGTCTTKNGRHKHHATTTFLEFP